LKIQPNTVIIGKRIPIGVMVGSVATILANLYPEYATSIVAGATVVTGLAQILVVNWLGVTGPKK
jgi:hypothetical protein